MCGIAGILDWQSKTEIGPAGLKMTHALARRGPDDWGGVLFSGAQTYRWGMKNDGPHAQENRMTENSAGLFLGHRRLSVIDLSDAGHQPMATPDGRFWIVFNGEIYNYASLRADLKADGVNFHSTSDTEVLLHLYARHGAACLEKIRGMFAFAVWDEQEQELFLARDRFGIKPLYYSRAKNGVFAFASEIRALFESGLTASGISPAMEAAFLSRGSIEAPHTFYQDVQALPPAHYAVVSKARTEIRAYWLLEGVLARAAYHDLPVVETARRIREALIESAAVHRVSDVPVGIFLSGGIDSTAVLAALRESYQGPLTTFTIIFPGTRWDESELARLAAKRYNTRHIEMEVTREDFFAALDDFFAVMDQPTIDGMNTYFVARMARKAGMKVVLSGLGGDEMLGGYASFNHVPEIERITRAAGYVPGLVGLSAALARQLPFAWAPKLEQLLEDAPAPLEVLWQDYRALFTRLQIDSLGVVPAEPVQRTEEIWERLEPFWKICALEIRHFMAPQLLRDSDVFTLCHGLELRTPFVDHVFIENVTRAGTWERGSHPSFKMALFREMHDFLPPDHLAVSKRGFVFPFEFWLREALQSGGEGVAGDMRRRLKAPEFQPWLEAFFRGRVHWSRIWALYVLARFRQRSES